MPGPRRVAVIGIGPSGISTLRHLSQYPDLFKVVGYEKNREAGGLWNYSDFTETDEYGLPCFASMYKQLRINLPTCLMAFQDRRFPDGLPSFVSYKDVKAYLDDYCKTFDLNKYCKFQTSVTNVVPKTTSNGILWLVTSRNHGNDRVTTETFDNVIVCNGKESVPFIPGYPGLDKFKGMVIHTKNLRDLSEYRGKTILLVGSSFSAQDIIFELAHMVPKMYVSHRSEGPLPFKMPKNVHDEPAVKEVLPNGIILENGKCREVDMIIFATGYKYHYPFLSDETQLTIKEERVQPIYNQMFHIEYPSLSFVGLLKGVLEFQVAQVQAHYVCAVLRGEIKLPNKMEMYRLEEKDFQERVVKPGHYPRYAHDMFGEDLQPYIENLQRETGKMMITPGVFKIWDVYRYVISSEFGTLKQRTFRLKGNDQYEMEM